jgi:putative transposase
MIQTQLKLKLTVAQEAKLNDWLWMLTGVWNWAVRKIELDAKDRVFHSKFDLEAMTAGHCKRLGIASNAVKATIFTAHNSWVRCFKKLAHKPRLKGNRNKLNSIPFTEPMKRPVNGRASIIVLGSVRFHKQDIPEGKIKCSRIVRRASGWYLCLFIDAERQPIERTANGQIGVDPGFKDLLTLSNGEVIEHPRELETGALRLAQVQRSKNKKLTARLQERIANRRKDRNHKLSLRLVKENAVIAFSADNHSGVANKFGKSVTSSGHAQLRQMLTYKSRAGGSRYIEVDSKFSTKRCSNCGSLSGPSGLSGLAVRRWTCGCGAEHDRDCNAAINTLVAGLGMSHERVALTPV